MLLWVLVVLRHAVLFGDWSELGSSQGVFGMVLILPAAGSKHNSGLNVTTDTFSLDLDEAMYGETWADLPHSLLEQPAKPLEWNDLTLEDDTLIAHRRRHHKRRGIDRRKEKNSSKWAFSNHEKSNQTYSQRRKRSVSYPPEEEISNIVEVIRKLSTSSHSKHDGTEIRFGKETVNEYLDSKISLPSKVESKEGKLPMSIAEPHQINGQPQLQNNYVYNIFVVKKLRSASLLAFDTSNSYSSESDNKDKSPTLKYTPSSVSSLKPRARHRSNSSSLSSVSSRLSISISPLSVLSTLSQSDSLLSSVKLPSITAPSTLLSTSPSPSATTLSPPPDLKGAAALEAITVDSGDISIQGSNNTFQNINLNQLSEDLGMKGLRNKSALRKETHIYLSTPVFGTPSVIRNRPKRWASDSRSQDKANNRSKGSSNSRSRDNLRSKSPDSLSSRSRLSPRRRFRYSQTNRLNRLKRLRMLRASIRRRIRQRPRSMPMAQAIVRRRPARVDAKVGVLVVVDNSIFRQYLKDNHYNRQDALAKIKRYYGMVFAMMDQRFGTIDDPSLSITVRISGILVAESREDASWLEEIVDWSTVSTHGRASFHTDKALRSFSTWITKHKGLPKHDHAMVFTGYRLSSRQGIGLGGMAYMKAVCDTDSGNAVSIVGDRGDFQNVKVATHELAHSLGAYHDGYPTATACPAEHNYIMTPVGSHQKNVLKNAFYFSRCSIRDMYNHLRKSRSACIRDEPVVYHQYDVTRYPPGHLYTADQQCKLIFGKNSQFCNVHQGPDSLEGIMCGLLWCKDPEKDNSCRTNSYLSALPGTTCGINKVCHLGQCIPDPQKRMEPSGRSSPGYHQSRPETRSAPYGSADKPTVLPTLRGRSNSLPGINQRPARPSFRMRGPLGSQDKDRDLRTSRDRDQDVNKSRDRDRESVLERRRLRNRRRNGRRRRTRRRRRHRSRPERERPKPGDKQSSNPKSRPNEVRPMIPELKSNQGRSGNHKSGINRDFSDNTTSKHRVNLYRPVHPTPRTSSDQHRPEKTTVRPDPYKREQPRSRSDFYRSDHPRSRSDFYKPERPRQQQPRSRSDPYRPQQPRSRSSPTQPQEPKIKYDPYRPQQPRLRSDVYRPNWPGLNTESQRPDSKLDPNRQYHTRSKYDTYKPESPRTRSDYYRPMRPHCTADKNPRYCQGLVRLNPGGCRRQAIREYCCDTCHYYRRR